MRTRIQASLVAAAVVLGMLSAGPAFAQTDIQTIRFKTDVVQDLVDLCVNMADNPSCPIRETYEKIEDKLTGIGDIGGSGGSSAGTIYGACTYLATSASTDPDRNTVLVHAQASASANSPLNPVVSTRVACELDLGSGRAGITMYGSEAQIVGTLDFDRHDDPNVCVSASASFLNGQSVGLNPNPKCGPLRGISFGMSAR